MSRTTPDIAGTQLQEGFFVVGIGASAGGLRVLQEFFRQVPADSGMAYIVILHLSPEYESKLASLLQPTTAIPIVEVGQKVQIEPDHLYLVRPNQHLLIDEGSIIPSDNLTMDERRAPVDILFRTLADNYGSRAVCVVLSGTGANGSMGLKRIKEMGGAVYVQSPREAEFNEMPRNSIATDLVDEVLPVAEIPARIIHYRNNQGAIQIVVSNEQRPDDQQQALREIFTQIRIRTGHDFSNYKRPTLLRRIERRINIRNLTSLPAYAEYIQHHPDETIALLKDLLISVTNFFRDQKAFNVIEQEALPAILQGKTAEDQVRIWVAGCATGEEAYSLAMLCAEQALGSIDAPKIQIFATDIDEAAIAIAREGFYTINDAADVSPERLRRFFNKEVEGYRVRREIREMILFANHNFLKDPPFSRLNMISCRNVLIYLNSTAQDRVMETFHFALNPGGILFLGNSESVDGASDLYSSYNRENHIFQSRQVPAKSYPIPESVPNFLYTQPGSPQSTGEKEVRPHRISFGELHQRLLEEYAPPSVVINEEYEIVHMTEKAGKYMKFGGGEPSQNLLKLVAPELRLDLRSALYQAVKRQTAVEARDLRVNIDGSTSVINIHIRPVLNPRDTSKGFMLVIFEPAAEQTNAPPVTISSDEPVARQLEEELLRVKAQLRNATEQHEFQSEELKASNEELQAMNEELRSAAEELETSKEELQSINEELRTVNQELKIKIEEVVLTSNNLQNLINSANIGTIFLDRSFRVALFTPPVREVFNLIDTDYGRPITDITSRLNYDHILQDAERVLEKLLVIEHEVKTVDGKVLLMRLLPYRTTDDRINGVVITFFDITNRKRAEESFRKSEERFRAFVTASSDVIYRTNANWTELVSLKGLEFITDGGEPANWLERYIPGAELPRVRAAIQRSIQGKTIFELEHQAYSAGGKINWVVSRAIPLLNSEGEISEWFGAATDITERRQAEEALRESEQRFRTLTQTVPALIWFNDAEGNNRYANQRFLDFTGNMPADITGKPWQLTIHEDDAPAYREDYLAAIRERRMFHKIFRARRADGEWRWLESFAQPLFDAGGTYLGHVGVTPDVTESKQQEEAVRDSETRFRTLTNAIPQVIWANDEQGKAHYFNQRWFEYSGLSYEESVGKGWEAIVHPDDAPASVSQWRAVLANGEVFDTEYRLRNAEGAYRWFIGRNVPLKDASGKVLGWFGSATDIEDLKQTGDLLRSTSERLQLALDAGKLGSYEYDFHSGIITCTPQHCTNFGLSGNEQVTLDKIKERIHPEDLHIMEDEFERSVNEHTTYAAEYRVRLDSGAVRWIRSTGRVVYDEKGAPQKMAGISIDITEHKLFTEELSKQVRERTTELQRSNDDLLQFAHVASHDLKEPVRKIQTFNNRIIDEFSDGLPQKAKTYLQKIEGATERIYSMIEGVLSYSKMSNNAQSFAPVDLNDIIQTIESDLEVPINIRNAIITTTELPTIRASSILMYQLFYNLISNALKFAKPNEPARITVSSKLIEVDRRAFAEISVADNGIGFEPEFSEAIFKTFTRLNPVEDYEGTGLGLSLCKKIVERHRGTITAKGHAGHGAVFTIRLPSM